MESLNLNMFTKKNNNLEYQDDTQLAGTRILVIDDEDQIRLLVRHILEGQGCIVQDVANGSLALQGFSTADYDVVITDMAMPGKDGIETIIEIRQLQPPVGIVAISGAETNKKLLTLASAFEADACLQKPFSVKQLLNAVRAARRKKS